MRSNLRLLLIGVVWVGMLLVDVTAPSSLPAPLEALQSPSWRHPLGADGLGRDAFRLLIIGTAHSTLHATLITLSVALTALAAGSLYMVMSPGLRRGLQMLLMVLLIIPPLILAIAILVSVGNTYRGGAIALTVGLVPVVSRYVITMVAQQFKRSHIDVARAHAASPARIVIEHLLPNILQRVIAYLPVIFIWVLGGLSALEFLGLVGSPSQPSLGRLIDDGRRYLSAAPHLTLAPALTLISLALLVPSEYNTQLE